jgi:hypothetical protein
MRLEGKVAVITGTSLKKALGSLSIIRTQSHSSLAGVAGIDPSSLKAVTIQGT